ncbi:MAG: hypothetical protein Q8O89_04300 [Nanoarchaeota archaeon]|nr:hypothetical protein [Nanoarchaeota archaeon]
MGRIDQCYDNDPESQRLKADIEDQLANSPFGAALNFLEKARVNSSGLETAIARQAKADPIFTLNEIGNILGIKAPRSNLTAFYSCAAENETLLPEQRQDALHQANYIKSFMLAREVANYLKSDEGKGLYTGLLKETVNAFDQMVERGEGLFVQSKS